MSSTFYRIFNYFILVLYVGQIYVHSSAIEVATTIPHNVKAILNKTNMTEVHRAMNNTRRIINGREAQDRPYMVYLKMPGNNPKRPAFNTWMCGGVIIHEEYILTSAACIEDAKHFYIVSGTFKRDEREDRYNNLCIKNGAKKAVWKCVPKNYIFDGHENDNIRWMNNDIAVVKIEDEFDFNRRIKGCDFVPKPICYNNRSAAFEKPGTETTIAGWGSTEKYSDWVNARRDNTVGPLHLLEAVARVIEKRSCKKRWGPRYNNIIENYMICSADLTAEMSEICNEKYVDCQDVADSASAEERRYMVHSAHNDRRVMGTDGGFCENDHGGPMVYGEGVNAMVIGIISACLVNERNNRCTGPFLYTSVWKNRNLIDCAIYKSIAGDCQKGFRSGVTYNETILSWTDHEDGPAKSEVAAIEARRKAEEKAKLNATADAAPSNDKVPAPANDKHLVQPNDKADKSLPQRGVIFRSFDDSNGTDIVDKSANVTGA